MHSICFFKWASYILEAQAFLTMINQHFVFTQVDIASANENSALNFLKVYISMTQPEYLKVSIK